MVRTFAVLPAAAGAMTQVPSLGNTDVGPAGPGCFAALAAPSKV